ncbi:MAG: hypothetical protein RIG62_30335 [Cyclobacteriaceae bacterium]
MDPQARNATPLTALIFLSIIVFGIAGYHYETGLPPWLMMLIGAMLGFIANTVFYYAFLYLGKGLARLPLSIIAAVLSAVAALVLVKNYAFRWPDGIFYPAAVLCILFTIIFYYSIKTVALRNTAVWAWAGIGITAIFLSGSLYWLQQEGSDPFAESLPPPFSDSNGPTLSDQGVENPATQGEYPVETFTYGSGRDKQRSAYAEDVTYTTPTVDASRLLPDWKGDKKKWRERYWGFGVTEFPLNGRVYLPEGEGPFPLVLVVHGNHSMIDFSDDGYGYLGELLASRGFITVSVDENFINSHWSGDFRGKEMPTRGWLLLKHLEQWQTWNNTSGHPLAGKVDMENILLMGHSRGGEAVSIAAGFNELPYFPDDAREAFDFHFNIRGVVAIAPTDYRYQRQISLKNINFLSLQGSYDADEASFWGMRPYRRLQFTDAYEGFKSGVYMHQANHGQFNSTWGRTDFGAPMNWLLNTEPMVSGEDQREAAKVWISAFAEATLNNHAAYRAMFKNSTLARDWLPAQYYLTHYRDAQTKTLVDFEEDIDLTTAGNNLSLQARQLKVWREEELRSRDDGSQENNAVVLGWDYGAAMHQDSLASYAILFPDSASLTIDTTGSMLITLAAGDFKELDQEGEKKKGDEAAREEPALDFSVQLSDQAGNTASLKISDVKRIAPRLKTRFTKLKSLDKDMIGDEWEVQLETFHLPIADFHKSNPDFNLQQLQKVELVFDQCNYGVLVVDDIGFDMASHPPQQDPELP